MDAVFQWHARPSEFGLCDPEEDFTVMLAYTRQVATMRSWEQQRADDKAEKNKAKTGRGRRR